MGLKVLLLSFDNIMIQLLKLAGRRSLIFASWVRRCVSYAELDLQMPSMYGILVVLTSRNGWFKRNKDNHDGISRIHETHRHCYDSEV
jgi:hypothetical protein